MPFSQPIGAPKGSLRLIDAPAAIYDDAPPGTWWYVFKDCSPFASVEFTFRWFGNADPSDLDTGKVSVIWYTDLSLAVVAWVDTFHLPSALIPGLNNVGSRSFVHLQVRGKVCTLVAPTSADTTASLTVTAQGSNRELSRNVFSGVDNTLDSPSNLVLSDVGGTLSGAQASQTKISPLLSGRVMLSCAAFSTSSADTLFRFGPNGVDVLLSGAGTQTDHVEIIVPRQPIRAFVQNRGGTTESWNYSVTREEY